MARSGDVNVSTSADHAGVASPSIAAAALALGSNARVAISRGAHGGRARFSSGRLTALVDRARFWASWRRGRRHFVCRLDGHARRDALPERRAGRARARLRTRREDGVARHPSTFARRRVTVAGLKDLDKDLAKVNPSEMRDALDGDDREVRQQAVIGIAGCAACGVMGWSLVTLRNTGCGLPPGPLGLVGAAEGVSYLYVVGLYRVERGQEGQDGKRPSRGTRRGPRPSGGVGVPLRPRGTLRTRRAGHRLRIHPQRRPRGGRPVLQLTGAHPAAAAKTRRPRVERRY